MFGGNFQTWKLHSAQDYFMSVSYTHLDVYKRQELYKIIGERFAALDSWSAYILSLIHI